MAGDISWTLIIVLVLLVLAVLYAEGKETRNENVASQNSFFPRQLVREREDKIDKQSTITITNNKKASTTEVTMMDKQEQRPQKELVQDKRTVTPAEQPQSKHQLVPVKDHDVFDADLFWAFKLETKAPWEKIDAPLMALVPTSGECKEWPSDLITNGKAASNLNVPLLARGGKQVEIEFTHPNGYRVLIDGTIGYTGQDRSILALAVDLRKSPMPAVWYTQGTFTLYKGC
jgi:hypothetical protein